MIGLLSRLIALLSFVVPRHERLDWREQWLGELQQLARERGAGTLVRVARGAIPDAFTARRLAAARRRRADSNTARGSWNMGVTWLDLKLALRMLVRYPGLTAVSVAGMSVGIAIAAGAFGILYRFTDPALPLEDGDRIVAILQWDTAANRAERRVLRDLTEWRAETTSLEDLGAFRQVTRNLIAPGSQPEAVRVAEMTASGFTLARVDPLMGRHLTADDEHAGAPPVVVIGHGAWRDRFLSDPGIVGRSIQLGDVHYTVVGVMPEGFEFPISNSYWIPLRVDAWRVGPREGPDLVVFGRLAHGATLESAQAEMTALGARAAAAYPQTHERLRPRVLPYTYPVFGLDDLSTARIVHLIQFLVTLLLVIVCVNVAILVYARTATRHGELVVRTALGASRRRIVGQLFLEALVLAAFAAALGLLLAHTGLTQVQAAMDVMYPQMPFWWNFTLSPGSLAYVIGLTVLAAAIIGVIPALKATGRQVQMRLQSLSAGGGSGMLLGKTWTALVVVQVAFAVMLVPVAMFQAWDSVRLGSARPGFAAGEFLTTHLAMDRASGSSPAAMSQEAFRARFTDRRAELLRRLRAEPAVSDVTFMSSTPGEEATAWIEIEGVRSPTAEEGQYGSGFAVRSGTAAGHEIRFNRVDVDMFDVLGVPILAGRAPELRDADVNAVIVNRSFTTKFFADSNPLGRRFRYVGASGDAMPQDVEFDRWFEIVGVVSDFPAHDLSSDVSSAKVYHLVRPEDLQQVLIAMRVRGTTPLGFAGRLREIAAEIDPNLQLRDLASLEDVMRRERAMLRIVASVLVALTAAVVLLSAAGVYAMMSFTVAQRRKEIGIRAALGADPRRILQSIFSRALAQLALGAALGIAAAAVLEHAADGDLMKGNAAVVLPIVSASMVVVGLLATAGPARRAFRIQPTEALRQE